MPKEWDILHFTYILGETNDVLNIVPTTPRSNNVNKQGKHISRIRKSCSRSINFNQDRILAHFVIFIIECVRATDCPKDCACVAYPEGTKCVPFHPIGNVNKFVFIKRSHFRQFINHIFNHFPFDIFISF